MIEHIPSILGMFCIALLSGCSTSSVNPTEMRIVQDVDALPAVRLDRMCIEVNTAVKSGFTDRLFDAIKELGFETQSKQSAFGNECSHWMSYKATWVGLPEYMATAEIKVYEDRRQLGHVRYDARKAGNRPDRYGTAIDKLKPLLEALLVRVDR